MRQVLLQLLAIKKQHHEQCCKSEKKKKLNKEISLDLDNGGDNEQTI